MACRFCSGGRGDPGASVDAFHAVLQTLLSGHNIRSEALVSSLQTNNIVVKVIIDVLADTETGLLIIDYKTGRGNGAS